MCTGLVREPSSRVEVGYFSVRQDLVGVERFDASTVDDDVAVGLEDPELAGQWIVEGAGLGEPGQVVEVSCKRDPPVAGELLGDRLLHSHYRKGREGESVPTVDDLGHRLDDLGGQAEPVAREFQFRSDARSSKRTLDPQVPRRPSSPMALCWVGQEGLGAHIEAPSIAVLRVLARPNPHSEVGRCL